MKVLTFLFLTLTASSTYSPALQASFADTAAIFGRSIGIENGKTAALVSGLTCLSLYFLYQKNAAQRQLIRATDQIATLQEENGSDELTTLDELKALHESHLNEIRTLQENHLNETRTLRENHLNKIKALRANHLNEIKDLRARHEKDRETLITGQPFTMMTVGCASVLAHPGALHLQQVQAQRILQLSQFMALREGLQVEADYCTTLAPHFSTKRGAEFLTGVDQARHDQAL